MTGLVLLALMALQSAAPAGSSPPSTRMDCRMIAANGTVLGFGLEARQDHGRWQAKVSPVAGSVWPETQSVFLDPLAGSAGSTDSNYRVGSGPNAMILDLLPPYRDQKDRFVELREARGEGEGLLVAHGYCGKERSPPLSNPHGTTGPGALAALRDPAGWPADCPVMARDGRRSRIRYGMNDQTTGFEPEDSGIWASGRVTVPRISPPPPPGRNGIRTNFATMLAGAGEQRPSFYEVAYIDQAARNLVIMLRFDRLGSAAHPADDSGFAICGWRNVEVAA